jgi:Prokaryotic phospholipase A2
VKRLLAIVLLLAMTSPALASRPTLEQKTIRQLSLGVTYTYFETARAVYQNSDERPWKNLDWSTNRCNDRPDARWFETFSVACVQHDFCKRNLPEIVRREDRIAELCDGKWKKEATRICRHFDDPEFDAVGCAKAVERTYARLRRGAVPNF